MSAGYRRAKVVVCTREMLIFARRPGTGEENVRSVPDFCRKLDENRVQKGKRGHLYP